MEPMGMLAGALGAFVADLAHDNTLRAPRMRAGRLYLGSVGTLCLGAIAGAVMATATAAPLAAMAAGFCGRRWLPALFRRMVEGSGVSPRRHGGHGEGRAEGQASE